MDVAIVPVMLRLHGCHFHVFVCVAAADIFVWWHFDTVFFFFPFKKQENKLRWGLYLVPSRAGAQEADENKALAGAKTVL